MFTMRQRKGKPLRIYRDTWVCPWCGAPKSAFVPEKQEAAPKAPVAPVELDGDMVKLSAGELSALCSNLARGCEKQYQEPEAALFKELADFFAAATPLEPGAELGRLAELFQEDLTADTRPCGRRPKRQRTGGPLRICVWGEKVTNILYALAQRYQKEGEAFLANTQVWVCTVCGFVYVGDTAPALCPVCKVPAWKFEKIEGRG